MHLMCAQAAPHFVWPLLIHQVSSELAIDRFHLQPTVPWPLQPLGFPETLQCKTWPKTERGTTLLVQESDQQHLLFLMVNK